MLAVRLALLWTNRTELQFDEAQYWTWSQSLALGYFSKPPLIAWIIRATTELCGDGEACVRLGAPLLHAATMAVVFLIGRRLYDARVGLVSALAYACLPGVSLSNNVVSTDAPLLLAWAVALWAYLVLLETWSLRAGVLLGLALGLGLLAKYAMGFFLVSAGVHLLATRNDRGVLRSPALYLALAIAAALLALNIGWNASHGFATVSHTAANAKWTGALFHPQKALEFLGSQFGVFGPVLFASLLVITWRAARSGLGEPDRLLLAFTLPIILLITVQALISRANPNWAGPAYVAGSVLVVATLLREGSRRALGASFAVNLAVAVLLSAALAFPRALTLPNGWNPFARTFIGWRAAAEATRERLDQARTAGNPFAVVLLDDRPLTAELLYYMRDEPTPVAAWMASPVPQDHYEMTRPFGPRSGEPVLLVSPRPGVSHVARSFATSTPLGQVDVAAEGAKPNLVHFFALTGYTPR